jgi:iron complex outermembrane receptor protein
MRIPFAVVPSRRVAVCLGIASAASAALPLAAQTNVRQQPYHLGTVVVTGEAAGAPPAAASVSVVPGRALEDRGITSPRELTALAPNLATFDANGDRTPRFSVRGMRENNFSYGESAVAIYVDDVPYSDLYTRGVPLFDLYAGEFYRGPQPTLFGANRPGGVLNLMTRLPGNQCNARGAVSYGNYNAVAVQAGADGPIVKDRLFFGVAGLFDRRDGYFDNLVTGHRPDDHETLAGRVQLRWTPTERLDFTASVVADRFHDGGVIVRPLAAPGDFYDVKYDQDGHNHQNSQTYALRGAWTGDSVKAVSITSWRRWEQDVAGDFDFAEFFAPNNLPLPGLEGFATPEVRQWAQEVRLESVAPDAAFKWNAGAYWSELTTDFAVGYHYGPLAPIVVSPTAPPAGTDLTSGRNRSDDYALFGQGTYTVAERLDLTAGLRLEYVDVRGNRNHTFDGFPMAAPRAYGDTFRSLQPRAGLAYHFTPDVVGWFNFTTGFQPGGFSSSSDNAGVARYAPAESRHYEIGASTKWLEGKLIVSASGFWIDTHNYQVYRPVLTGSLATPLDFYILNAHAARTLGGELEVRALPCEYFEFRVAAGYQRATFEDFTTPDGLDFSGNTINFVPQFTLDTSVTARMKCGAYATVGVTAVGDYWFDEANTVRQNPFALLHARVGWQGKHIGVAVFGRNLTGEEYYANALDLGPRGGPDSFFIGTPGDPLTVGGEISVRF